MAHLLCELYARHEAVGLLQNASFEFDITQAELGDALGLSTVHVNRTVRELRARGLIGQNGSTIQVLDPEGLQAECDFDPTYLHQD
ncbi:helix-turn-helix domain-containing protein, partial [Nostoc linckia]|uniref:helix-turn-helix domain-containing protein n=1 Tax=Nostoc linckia TaxID=92942 RepID=UPI001C55728A